MSFILKTCEIVAGATMIHQFHEFFEFIFVGFLKVGPALIAGPAFRKFLGNQQTKHNFPVSF